MSCENDQAQPLEEKRKARVLVADDEVGLRDLLKRFLESRGHEALIAENGIAALELFQNEPVDLVLTDLRMPGLSGLQLLVAIKEINPRMPVVIVSGYGDIETVVTALKNGAENFLAKPIRIDLLDRVVQQSLRLSARPLKPKAGFERLEQSTEVVVASRPSNINDLIYLVSLSAVAVGYAEHDLDSNLKLALVEAITNAMEHGNQWDSGKTITMSLWLTASELKVRITDQGDGFDYHQVGDPTHPDNLMSERGRGIFLMNAIMDEVVYHQSGNSVSMTKKRDN